MTAGVEGNRPFGLKRLEYGGENLGTREGALSYSPEEIRMILPGFDQELTPREDKGYRLGLMTTDGNSMNPARCLVKDGKWWKYFQLGDRRYYCLQIVDGKIRVTISDSTERINLGKLEADEVVRRVGCMLGGELTVNEFTHRGAGNGLFYPGKRRDDVIEGRVSSRIFKYKINFW